MKAEKIGKEKKGVRVFFFVKEWHPDSRPSVFLVIMWGALTGLNIHTVIWAAIDHQPLAFFFCSLFTIVTLGHAVTRASERRDRPKDE